MLGFDLDFWDYATFATAAIAGGCFIAILVFMMGLPGRIAIARNHPEAEAVNIMGYAGFFTVVPWIQAFIWAFKPTDVVDIRRFPAAEIAAIEAENARLRGTPRQRAIDLSQIKATPEAPPETPPDTPGS